MSDGNTVALAALTRQVTQTQSHEIAKQGRVIEDLTAHSLYLTAALHRLHPSYPCSWLTCQTGACVETRRLLSDLGLAR